MHTRGEPEGRVPVQQEACAGIYTGRSKKEGLGKQLSTMHQNVAWELTISVVLSSSNTALLGMMHAELSDGPQTEGRP